MAQITGGKVRYRRVVKVTEYEPKEAEAILDFAVGDDEDYHSIFNEAASVAQAKVIEMLGGKAQPSVTQVPTPAAETGGKKVDGRTRAAKDQKAASNPPQAAPSETLEVEGDIPGFLDRKKQEAAKAVGKTEEKDPTAISDDDLLGSAAPDVTDEALTQAITKHNGKVQNPDAIRQLIGKYVAHPGRASDIPKGARHQFLKDLAGIGPKA
jgi:hypothetical protein